MKKIFFFFDSRATYSYSKNIIKHIDKFRNLTYRTIVSGTYLDKNFGDISKNFKLDKIRIDKKIKFKTSNNKIFSWSYNLGEAIKNYSKTLSKLRPDLVLITGDRIETLAFCITASYMNIPIAHIQAGDKSGHIDDLARGAIAKFTNIHFPSCYDSKQRLLKQGEKNFRIFNLGAPQLDDIHEFISKEKKIKHDRIKNILLIFHPVLNEVKKIDKQFENILQACITFNVPINFIYPNNDFGYKNILKIITNKKYASKINIHKNLERIAFLKLLKNTSVIVGNSSCGIIEAPSFKIPTINIGSRQNDRPRAKSVIDTNYNKKNIIRSIKFAFNNKKFKLRLAKTKNVFYKKNSGYLICGVLNKVLNKKINFDMEKY